MGKIYYTDRIEFLPPTFRLFITYYHCDIIHELESKHTPMNLLPLIPFVVFMLQLTGKFKYYNKYGLFSYCWKVEPGTVSPEILPALITVYLQQV